MRLAGRGAIETGREDALFKDEHAPDKGTVTGAAFRNRVSDFHKV
jgi:hypothetical protein